MNKIDVQRRVVCDDRLLWEEQQRDVAQSGGYFRARYVDQSRELEGLGNSDRDQIASRLVILIAHLLKWQFQPANRSESWRATITEQRARIARVIRRAPGLAGYPGEAMGRQYPASGRLAARETGLPIATFPNACPYSISEVVDDAFLPGGREERE